MIVSKNVIRRGKKIVLFILVLHIVYVILLIWMPVYTTPTIAFQFFSGKKIYKTWMPMSKISDAMQQAVIAEEDQDFDNHFGFDVKAIEKAIEYNKTHKQTKGASTITQQVAKNVFLWQRRDFVRKGLEAYFTVLIELLWSKKHILEVYLNVAEMGDGVFGCEAAAQKYFHTTAAKLTDEQSALIAACLPNPILFKVNAPTEYMRTKQKWILSQMGNIDWDGN